MSSVAELLGVNISVVRCPTVGPRATSGPTLVTRPADLVINLLPVIKSSFSFLTEIKNHVSYVFCCFCVQMSQVVLALKPSAKCRFPGKIVPHTRCCRNEFKLIFNCVVIYAQFNKIFRRVRACKMVIVISEQEFVKTMKISCQFWKVLQEMFLDPWMQRKTILSPREKVRPPWFRNGDIQALLLTDFKEQPPCWEVRNLSNIQDNLCVLWNMNFHFCVLMTPLLASGLTYINALHALRHISLRSILILSLNVRCYIRCYHGMACSVCIWRSCGQPTGDNGLIKHYTRPRTSRALFPAVSFASCPCVLHSSPITSSFISLF
jgi:hypothetical protein